VHLTFYPGKAAGASQLERCLLAGDVGMLLAYLRKALLFGPRVAGVGICSGAAE
jgi:hypothetical protein